MHGDDNEQSIGELINQEKRTYRAGWASFKDYGAMLWSLIIPAPFKVVSLIGLLLIAGVLEGIGIAAFLPLINIVTQTEPTGSTIEVVVGRFLAFFGADTSLMGILIFIVGAISVKSLFNFVALRYAAGHFVADLNTGLQIKLLRANVQRSWDSLVDLKLGHLLSVVTVETNRAATFFIHFCNLVQISLRVCLFVGMAVLLSWQVTIIGVIAGVIMTTVLWKYVTMARHASKLLKACLRDLGAQVSDAFHNIKSLKAMGKENWIIKFFDVKIREMNRQLKRQILSTYGLREFQQIFIVVPVAVSTYVFVAILQRDFNEFLLLGVLLQRTMTNIAQLQQTLQSFLMTGVYYRSVTDFLKEAVDDGEQLSVGSALGTVPEFKKAISLHEVSFAYRERGPLIVNANLEIPYQRVTALIGPSGAGKTTIANMLCGLHRPTSGSVRLDAVSLWECDVSMWRGMIGYVAQECILFNGTIYDNIVLDPEGIEPVDVDRAVAASGLSDFIRTLPDGLTTAVGESGLKISGGQRQRMAIARAIVHQPKLLILDEATAGLDPETERKLCDTFKSLSKDTTIFAISHQEMVGTIADVMYDLRDGTVRRID